MRLLHLAHVTGPLSTRQGRCRPPSVLEAHGVRQGKPVLNRGAGDRERWWPQLPHMDTEPGPCVDRATEARAPIEAAVWGGGPPQPQGSQAEDGHGKRAGLWVQRVSASVLSKVTSP